MACKPDKMTGHETLPGHGLSALVAGMEVHVSAIAAARSLPGAVDFQGKA